MTPEKPIAQEEAIEALIAAGLRVPHTEMEVTGEDISRYVEQNVTLSKEDEIALERAKPGMMQTIKEVLHKSQPIDCDCTSQTVGTEQRERPSSSSHRRASDEFVEAVVIGQLTRMLASPEYPLGRFRYNKLAYFSHRKAEENVVGHYSKQPAGPYSPWAKYQGPEQIALRNGYVKRVKTGALEGLVVGEKIDKLDQYLSHYPVCAAVDWVVSKFRYRKKDDLELLATVDFAALDLVHQGIAITMEAIKSVIAGNKTWAPKLRREVFSDQNIIRALAELKALFPGTYQ